MTQTNYTEQEIINMINTLQDEESQKANTKYNFERFIGKEMKSLRAIQNDIKVASNLWSNVNRTVRLYSRSPMIVSDDFSMIEYDNLYEAIKAQPDAIIDKIEAFGIFSINIYIK